RIVQGIPGKRRALYARGISYRRHFASPLRPRCHLAHPDGASFSPVFRGVLPGSATASRLLSRSPMRPLVFSSFGLLAAGCSPNTVYRNSALATDAVQNNVAAIPSAPPSETPATPVAVAPSSLAVTGRTG